MWGNRLSRDLIDKGFTQMPTCPSLFFHHEKVRILVVYVDDGIICSKKKEGVEFAKSVLRELYEITDLGRASWFLGVVIRRLPEVIAINQQAYIESILEKF